MRGDGSGQAVCALPCLKGVHVGEVASPVSRGPVLGSLQPFGHTDDISEVWPRAMVGWVAAQANDGHCRRHPCVTARLAKDWPGRRDGTVAPIDGASRTSKQSVRFHCHGRQGRTLYRSEAARFTRMVEGGSLVDDLLQRNLYAPTKRSPEV